MKRNKTYFIKKAKNCPENCIKIETNKHTTYIDWSECMIGGSGRIYWKKNLSKTVYICRDDDVRSFEIISYIEHPSDTAHDAKIIVRNKETDEDYSLWSRDFKQGDVGKLFK